MGTFVYVKSIFGISPVYFPLGVPQGKQEHPLKIVAEFKINDDKYPSLDDLVKRFPCPEIREND